MEQFEPCPFSRCDNTLRADPFLHVVTDDLVNSLLTLYLTVGVSNLRPLVPTLRPDTIVSSFTSMNLARQTKENQEGLQYDKQGRQKPT